jgi:hypothetical protein
MRAARLARLLVFTMFSLAQADAVFAAEPFVTDDAEVIPRGTCKIEAGKLGQADGRETWLQPACNLFSNIELELAHRVARSDGEARSSLHSVQAKGVWREMERDGYGAGWLVKSDIARHPQPDERRIREYAAALLVSYPAIADRVVLHANLGTRWDRTERKGAITAGFLAELEVHERLALLAEIYGVSRERRGIQAGLRFALVPDHVELTISRGGDHPSGRGRRYWAVSIEAVSPKLVR